MRFLLIPLDSYKHQTDDRMFGDMFRAFNKDIKDEAMMYNDDVQEAIIFKPDVVFYQGGVNRDICEAIKLATDSYWVTWTGDVRYAPMEHLVLCKDFTDLFLLPFTGNMLKRYYRCLGVPCRFIWEPFQNWKFIEPKQMNEGKITFVGNKYNTVPGGEERGNIVPFLKQFFPEFEAYGSGWDKEPIDNFSVPQLYNDSYAVICDNNWNDIASYFTPRNLNAMSAGSCAVMRYFPNIEQFFKNYEHCIYYKHKYELLDVLSFLKNSPDIRNKIARQGYDHAKKNFTFDNFVEQFKAVI